MLSGAPGKLEILVINISVFLPFLYKLISYGISLDLQDNMVIKNQDYFCHSRIRNKYTCDYLTGTLLCIPNLPPGSTSLAIYTIYAQVSCIVQLTSKCTLLTQALNP